MHVAGVWGVLEQNRQRALPAVAGMPFSTLSLHARGPQGVWGGAQGGAGEIKSSLSSTCYVLNGFSHPVCMRRGGRAHTQSAKGGGVKGKRLLLPPIVCMRDRAGGPVSPYSLHA